MTPKEKRAHANKIRALRAGIDKLTVTMRNYPVGTAVRTKLNERLAAAQCELRALTKHPNALD